VTASIHLVSSSLVKRPSSRSAVLDLISMLLLKESSQDEQEDKKALIARMIANLDSLRSSGEEKPSLEEEIDALKVHTRAMLSSQLSRPDGIRTSSQRIARLLPWEADSWRSLLSSDGASDTSLLDVNDQALWE
jgi:hypothetical protein